MKHPFLEERFDIQWSQLRPECIEADVKKAIIDAKEAITKICKEDLSCLTFENTLLALEEATRPLDEAWGKISHLDAVCNTEELRKAYNSMLPEVSDFYSQLFLNDALWEVVQSFAHSKQAQKLTGPYRRFLDETLADFKENGADLCTEKKQRLAKINIQLAEFCQKYSENVLDATNAWELVIHDVKQLDGLPPSALEAAKANAISKGLGTAEKPAWRFTLHTPSFLPIMQYLHDDTLRQAVWQASSSVGYQPPYDNTDLIWQILSLRHEKAQLLGYAHFADFVLKRRMATTGKKALAFVEDMHHRITKHFRKENQSLEDFKAKALKSKSTPLQPWEFAYWAEKMRQEHYAFDEEALRPYFPLESVIRGLFQLSETLFNIQIKEQASCFKEYSKKAILTNDSQEVVEVWHPEVKFYKIVDTDSGVHLGSFYTDWHPRSSKRGGAWMNHLLTGGPTSMAQHKPHLGLICGNLTPPTPDKPSLLTHREVETVFHEFGHLLHHILGSVPIKSLNGTNVAWDFVELPSQIMENWCWERESLDLFARHYKTLESIPEKLFQKMLKVRNYLSAMDTMRQLAFAKMDLELHMHYEDFKGHELESLIKAILANYLPRYKTQPLSMVRRFSHLFASPTGYAAGYYSYKWAEVLDADAFTRFKKEGILNKTTGASFREEILSKGNSEKPEVLFKNFMGREPNPQALLERAGLAHQPEFVECLS